ncbi:unnamed protein product [Amoebophrya sp. A25]|nr:unnamed protein product [Amoebophrya sp. A25]|eukprot:GSA25T00019668001.1
MASGLAKTQIEKTKKGASSRDQLTAKKIARARRGRKSWFLVKDLCFKQTGEDAELFREFKKAMLDPMTRWKAQGFAPYTDKQDIKRQAIVMADRTRHDRFYNEKYLDTRELMFWHGPKMVAVADRVEREEYAVADEALRQWHRDADTIRRMSEADPDITEQDMQQALEDLGDKPKLPKKPLEERIATTLYGVSDPPGVHQFASLKRLKLVDKDMELMKTQARLRQSMQLWGPIAGNQMLAIMGDGLRPQDKNRHGRGRERSSTSIHADKGETVQILTLQEKIEQSSSGAIDVERFLTFVIDYFGSLKKVFDAIATSGAGDEDPTKITKRRFTKYLWDALRLEASLLYSFLDEEHRGYFTFDDLYSFMPYLQDLVIRIAAAAPPSPPRASDARSSSGNEDTATAYDNESEAPAPTSTTQLTAVATSKTVMDRQAKVDRSSNKNVKVQMAVQQRQKAESAAKAKDALGRLSNRMHGDGHSSGGSALSGSPPGSAPSGSAGGSAGSVGLGGLLGTTTSSAGGKLDITGSSAHSGKDHGSRPTTTSSSAAGEGRTNGTGTAASSRPDSVSSRSSPGYFASRVSTETARAIDIFADVREQIGKGSGGTGSSKGSFEQLFNLSKKERTAPTGDVFVERARNGYKKPLMLFMHQLDTGAQGCPKAPSCVMFRGSEHVKKLQIVLNLVQKVCPPPTGRAKKLFDAFTRERILDVRDLKDGGHYVVCGDAIFNVEKTIFSGKDFMVETDFDKDAVTPLPAFLEQVQHWTDDKLQRVRDRLLPSSQPHFDLFETQKMLDETGGELQDHRPITPGSATGRSSCYNNFRPGVASVVHQGSAISLVPRTDEDTEQQILAGNKAKQRRVHAMAIASAGALNRLPTQALFDIDDFQDRQPSNSRRARAIRGITYASTLTGEDQTMQMLGEGPDGPPQMFSGRDAATERLNALALNDDEEEGGDFVTMNEDVGMDLITPSYAYGDTKRAGSSSSGIPSRTRSIDANRNAGGLPPSSPARTDGAGSGGDPDIHALNINLLGDETESMPQLQGELDPAAPGESKAELDEWLAGLDPDQANSAATKLQSRRRQKVANSTVSEKRTEKMKKQEHQKCPPASSSTLQGGTSERHTTTTSKSEEGEDLDEWLKSLGEGADAAASRLQARRRQKTAAAEARRRRAQKANDATREANAKAEAERKRQEQEDLENWAMCLGEEANEAATKMQAKRRQRAAAAEAKARRAQRAQEKERLDAQQREKQELDEWMQNLGEEAEAAASKLQALRRKKSASEEVKRKQAKKRAAEDQAAKVRKEMEEVQQWAASLGDDANAAASKLQSKIRARKAAEEAAKEKQEQEQKREADRERRRQEMERHDEIIHGGHTPREATPEDAEEQAALEKEKAEVEAWAKDLGEDADRAATKLQTLRRQKAARREVSKKREAKMKEEAAKKEQEEIAAWAKDLGEEGNAVAVKMQGKARQCAARKEVEKKRSAKKESDAALEKKRKEKEELEVWTKELGAEADAAALKMQNVQRRKQASRKVEQRRSEVKAKGEAEAKRKAEQAELGDWVKGLGDDGHEAALKMQKMQRQKLAKREAQRRRNQGKKELKPLLPGQYREPSAPIIFDSDDEQQKREEGELKMEVKRVPQAVTDAAEQAEALPATTSATAAVAVAEQVTQEGEKPTVTGPVGAEADESSPTALTGTQATTIEPAEGAAAQDYGQPSSEANAAAGDAGAASATDHILTDLAQQTPAVDQTPLDDHKATPPEASQTAAAPITEGNVALDQSEDAAAPEVVVDAVADKAAEAVDAASAEAPAERPEEVAQYKTCDIEETKTPDEEKPASGDASSEIKPTVETVEGEDAKPATTSAEESPAVVASEATAASPSAPADEAAAPAAKEDTELSPREDESKGVEGTHEVEFVSSGSEEMHITLWKNKSPPIPVDDKKVGPVLIARGADFLSTQMRRRKGPAVQSQGQSRLESLPEGSYARHYYNHAVTDVPQHQGENRRDSTRNNQTDEQLGPSASQQANGRSVDNMGDIETLGVEDDELSSRHSRMHDPTLTELVCEQEDLADSVDRTSFAHLARLGRVKVPLKEEHEDDAQGGNVDTLATGGSKTRLQKPGGKGHRGGTHSSMKQESSASMSNTHEESGSIMSRSSAVSFNLEAERVDMVVPGGDAEEDEEECDDDFSDFQSASVRALPRGESEKAEQEERHERKRFASPLQAKREKQMARLGTGKLTDTFSFDEYSSSSASEEDPDAPLKGLELNAKMVERSISTYTHGEDVKREWHREYIERLGKRKAREDYEHEKLVALSNLVGISIDKLQRAGGDDAEHENKRKKAFRTFSPSYLAQRQSFLEELEKKSRDEVDATLNNMRMHQEEVERVGSRGARFGIFKKVEGLEGDAWRHSNSVRGSYPEIIEIRQKPTGDAAKTAKPERLPPKMILRSDSPDLKTYGKEYPYNSVAEPTKLMRRLRKFENRKRHAAIAAYHRVAMQMEEQAVAEAARKAAEKKTKQAASVPTSSQPVAPATTKEQDAEYYVANLSLSGSGTDEGALHSQRAISFVDHVLDDAIDAEGSKAAKAFTTSTQVPAGETAQTVTAPPVATIAPPNEQTTQVAAAAPGAQPIEGGEGQEEKEESRAPKMSSDAMARQAMTPRMRRELMKKSKICQQVKEWYLEHQQKRVQAGLPLHLQSFFNKDSNVRQGAKGSAMALLAGGANAMKRRNEIKPEEDVPSTLIRELIMRYGHELMPSTEVTSSNAFEKAAKQALAEQSVVDYKVECILLQTILDAMNLLPDESSSDDDDRDGLDDDNYSRTVSGSSKRNRSEAEEDPEKEQDSEAKRLKEQVSEQIVSRLQQQFGVSFYATEGLTEVDSERVLKGLAGREPDFFVAYRVGPGFGGPKGVIGDNLPLKKNIKGMRGSGPGSTPASPVAGKDAGEAPATAERLGSAGKPLGTADTDSKGNRSAARSSTPMSAHLSSRPSTKQDTLRPPSSSTTQIFNASPIVTVKTREEAADLREDAFFRLITEKSMKNRSGWWTETERVELEQQLYHMLGAAEAGEEEQQVLNLLKRRPGAEMNYGQSDAKETPEETKWAIGERLEEHYDTQSAMIFENCKRVLADNSSEFYQFLKALAPNEVLSCLQEVINGWADMEWMQKTCDRGPEHSSLIHYPLAEDADRLELYERKQREAQQHVQQYLKTQRRNLTSWKPNKLVLPKSLDRTMEKSVRTLSQDRKDELLDRFGDKVSCYPRMSRKNFPGLKNFPDVNSGRFDYGRWLVHNLAALEQDLENEGLQLDDDELRALELKKLAEKMARQEEDLRPTAEDQIKATTNRRVELSTNEASRVLVGAGDQDLLLDEEHGFDNEGDDAEAEVDDGDNNLHTASTMSATSAAAQLDNAYLRAEDGEDASADLYTALAGAQAAATEGQHNRANAEPPINREHELRKLSAPYRGLPQRATPKSALKISSATTPSNARLGSSPSSAGTLANRKQGKLPSPSKQQVDGVASELFTDGSKHQTSSEGQHSAEAPNRPHVVVVTGAIDQSVSSFDGAATDTQTGSMESSQNFGSRDDRDAGPSAPLLGSKQRKKRASAIAEDEAALATLNRELVMRRVVKVDRDVFEDVASGYLPASIVDLVPETYAAIKSPSPTGAATKSMASSSLRQGGSASLPSSPLFNRGSTEAARERTAASASKASRTSTIHSSLDEAFGTTSNKATNGDLVGSAAQMLLARRRGRAQELAVAQYLNHNQYHIALGATGPRQALPALANSRKEIKRARDWAVDPADASSVLLSTPDKSFLGGASGFAGSMSLSGPIGSISPKNNRRGTVETDLTVEPVSPTRPSTAVVPPRRSRNSATLDMENDLRPLHEQHRQGAATSSSSIGGIVQADAPPGARSYVHVQDRLKTEEKAEDGSDLLQDMQALEDRRDMHLDAVLGKSLHALLRLATRAQKVVSPGTQMVVSLSERDKQLAEVVLQDAWANVGDAHAPGAAENFLRRGVSPEGRLLINRLEKMTQLEPAPEKKIPRLSESGKRAIEQAKRREEAERGTEERLAAMATGYSMTPSLPMLSNLARQFGERMQTPRDGGFQHGKSSATPGGASVESSTLHIEAPYRMIYDATKTCLDTAIEQGTAQKLQ